MTCSKIRRVLEWGRIEALLLLAREALAVRQEFIPGFVFDIAFWGCLADNGVRHGLLI